MLYMITYLRRLLPTLSLLYSRTGGEARV